VVTPGRYFFSPPGTPHYPNIHLLYSAVWSPTELKLQPDLGELLERTAYDTGDAPPRLPLPVIVGDKNCIRDGENEADMIDVESLDSGFPTECFKVPPAPQNRFGDLQSIHGPCTQKFFATLISLLYDGNEAAAKAMLSSVLGATPATLTWHAGTATRPTVLTAVGAHDCVVVMDGTTTFQQFAVQALESLAGPVNVGPFSTMPFWNDTATYVIELMELDGITAQIAWTVVGHSWGGVTSAILNARSLAVSDHGRRQCLTFGMPKPGNDELVALLDQVDCVHVANDNDIVAIVPFDVSVLAPVVPVFGPTVLVLWPRWEFAHSVFTLDANGVARGERPLFPETETLANIIQQVFDHESLDVVTGHLIATYIDRLTLACPD